MVRRAYSHLGTVRHRSEVVESRLEQHYARLGDQLVRLGFDIKSVIKGRAGEARESPAITQGEAGEDLPEWARRDSNARPLAPEAPASAATIAKYRSGFVFPSNRASVSGGNHWQSGTIFPHHYGYLEGGPIGSSYCPQQSTAGEVLGQPRHVGRQAVRHRVPNVEHR
jgi:hypothetical protein